MTAQALHERPCSCGPEEGDLPVALLSASVHDPSLSPSLMALTVDYELKSWRASALATHVVDWALDFALRRSERAMLTPGRATELARRAIKITFGNGDDRGVPGEVLLHAVCRQFFGSDTVINKVWFKTASNDTYKGFDSVHCVHQGDELQLWLGEAKFYKSLTSAIRSVATDLDEHLDQDYLRFEFALIADKIDADHPHGSELRRLMHPHTSLDEVFDRIVVPVFVAYESMATAAHDHVCAEYREALEAEVRRAWIKFGNAIDSNLPVVIRLFLLPMGNKKALTDALDQELSRWR